LPKSYQRNFTKGFDGFLCLHLKVEPKDVIDCVKSSHSEENLNKSLMELFPKDLRTHEWNRRVVQIGMSDMALEKLKEIKEGLDAGDREDLRSFADVIDFDEQKIT
jgi:DNA-binding Xre family transcriptional regulator